jgi:hypothetical protein
VREQYVAAGVDVVDLDSYHLVAGALFDEAYATVREAYQDCVAATYGRLWAKSSTPEDGRAVFYWLKALADVGFSVEECYSVLHDIETVCPAAISKCRETQDEWFLSPSDT